MTRKKSSEKRAYLARDERRLALLDVAASVVEQQGWPALSMISVAETAKVSRQLVYQHFTSVDELMADTMSHLFRDRYETIRSSISSNPTDLRQLMQMVDQQTFDENPGRVRALWQMITATYSDNAETSRMGRRLRHLLTKLWEPMLAQRLDFNAAQIQAMVWMLQMAFWGAHQLVHDGEISRKGANELFVWMLARLLGPGADAPLPKTAVPTKPAKLPRTAATARKGALPKRAAKPAARRKSTN
jgi:AcrR family transcriptional regulator